MRRIRYIVERRIGGFGAVVRIGARGGKKYVAVYRDVQTAQDVEAFLNGRSDREA
jgi:hypothetical protein